MKADDRRARQRLGPPTLIWALAVGLLAAGSGVSEGGRPPQVPPRSTEPSLQVTTAEVGGHVLRIGVPPTWRKLRDDLTVMFAPEDGQAVVGGKAHVLYGVELSVSRTTRGDPSGVLDDVVRMFKGTNPELRSASITRLVTLAGRLGLRGTFANTSSVTGRPEFVVIAAALLDPGRALYVVGVAPEERFGTFRPTLEAILLSLEKG